MHLRQLRLRRTLLLRDRHHPHGARALRGAPGERNREGVRRRPEPREREGCFRRGEERRRNCAQGVPPLCEVSGSAGCQSR